MEPRPNFRFRSHVEDTRPETMFDSIPLTFGNRQIDPVQDLHHFQRLCVKVRATRADQKLMLKFRLGRDFFAIEDLFGKPFTKFFAVMHSLYPLTSPTVKCCRRRSTT